MTCISFMRGTYSIKLSFISLVCYMEENSCHTEMQSLHYTFNLRDPKGNYLPFLWSTLPLE